MAWVAPPRLRLNRSNSARRLARRPLRPGLRSSKSQNLERQPLDRLQSTHACSTTIDPPWEQAARLRSRSMRSQKTSTSHTRPRRARASRTRPCADGSFKRSVSLTRTSSSTAASSPRTRPPSASSSKSSTRNLRVLLPRAISGTWSQSTRAQSLMRSSSSSGTTSTGGARRKAPAAASTYASL